MRAHGTRARYMHGAGPGEGDGCRCVDCSIAAGDYERERQRQRRAGVPAYIDATEARGHLEWLSGQGIGTRTVAARTGLSRSTVTKIRKGESTQCRQSTADRILGVHLGKAAPGAYIDGTRTLEQVQDIIDQGWTRVGIARRIVSLDARALQIAPGGRVTSETASKVAALHREVMAPVDARRDQEAARQRSYRARRVDA